MPSSDSDTVPLISIRQKEVSLSNGENVNNASNGDNVNNIPNGAPTPHQPFLVDGDKEEFAPDKWTTSTNILPDRSP